MLKYGLMPSRTGRRVERAGEIPSYKKDAMKLIINRIYRYIGNVFHDLQRKVMLDDIMRQRKELYELMNGNEKNEEREISSGSHMDSVMQKINNMFNENEQNGINSGGNGNNKKRE